MSSVFDGDEPVTKRLCDSEMGRVADNAQNLRRLVVWSGSAVGLLVLIFIAVVGYNAAQADKAVEGMRQATTEFRIETTRATEADKSLAETLAEIRANIKQLQDNQQAYIRTQERLTLNQERILKIIDNGRGPGGE